MITGFGISHYRNFADTESFLVPLSKVNAFIGANNSGKSNVLRFIRDILIPTTTRDARKTPIKDSGINIPRRARTSTISVAYAVDASPAAISKLYPSAHAPYVESVSKQLISYLDSDRDKYIFIRITKPSHGDPEQVDLTDVDLSKFRQDIFRSIWTSDGRGGGDFNHSWFPDILLRLYQRQKIPLPYVYIPAFRQIDSRLDEFHDEFRAFSSGAHIIDELATYESPTYGEQDKRKSFDKLVDFISDITGIVDLQVRIPHDKSTVDLLFEGNYLPIEAFGAGIHELFMLAAQVILAEGKVVLLEEPEAHMHPDFQRKLMSFIINRVEGQFFVTTHSPTLIDFDEVSVFGVSTIDGEAIVRPLLRDQSRRTALHSMGFRASDLLQSNCAIWVEGPSDRVYVLAWLKEVDPELREDIEFSFMYYGGRVLSHYSASDETSTDEFLKVLPINRFPAILMDSDKKKPEDELGASKQRVISEISGIGGLAWVTAGREIENYCDSAPFLDAAKATHPSVARFASGTGQWADYLALKKDDGEKLKSPDKVRIAREFTSSGVDLSVLDLREQVQALAGFIRKANGI